GIASTAGSGFGGAPSGGFGGGFASGGPGGGTGGGPGVGSGGGLSAGTGGGSSADSALTAYLESHAGTSTWIVATSSTQNGADIELATGEPVLAMGGFTGSDPALTVDELKTLVTEGKLRYVLVGGGGGPGGGPSGGGPGGGSSSVLAWVEENGTAVDYGGSSGTLYDLSTALATDTSTTGG
ncbi:MAG TPA: hypothetical protein VEG29_08525, partial [Candidatus Binatia bacterium]|nr:hypothetical protein [Candidatus Binatia bacterium]